MDTSTLTREQLEDRLAALHRASLELIRDISPESLMERIAILACEQVSARYAAVGILDEKGRLEKFIPVGMTPGEIARISHPPVGKGLIGELMRSETPIRLAEIAADPHSSGFPPHHPPMSSFLGVPIRHGELTLGQIYLTNKLNAPEFTLDDQAVIEMLASYAAAALSNARLVQMLTDREASLTRRTENLALLNDLASTLASSIDIDLILAKAILQVMEYLNLDVGEVFLRQEDGKYLQMVLHHGSSVDRLWVQNQFQFGEGLIGKAALSSQPALVDLSSDRAEPAMNLNGFNPQVFDGRLNQVACFPLTGRSGVFGVLCVASSHAQPLDDLEIHFLSSIGFWVGTAIENARLNIQQRRLAVLEERERIGMDLHDGIIQDIYAVGLTLEHARLLLNDDPSAARTRIEQAVSDLNSTIRDIRAYILDLRPRKLHEENLMDGLRRLVAEFRANTLVEVTLQGPPEDHLFLPEGTALVLFHICQETLANAAKHAHARRVSVTVWTAAGRALMEVSDDGRGFDTSQVQLTLGHGLSNIHTRAVNAGGEVEITSEPGQGTTVLVWVPLPPMIPPEQRAAAVRGMFSAIAPRYDLMNRLMTAGMDISWRKEVIRRAAPQPGERLLDLGAGTGDLAREALRQQPACRVTAGDFTLNMMLAGKASYPAPQDWTAADALNLPFPAASFDALVSGFLMRNVVDLDQALREQRRVLRPGGRLVCLDTTRPGRSLLSPFIRFHMRRVIPLLGALFAGSKSAYTYLPETSERFLSAEELLARIQAAGFSRAGFRRVNFGTVAIHWAAVER